MGAKGVPVGRLVKGKGGKAAVKESKPVDVLVPGRKLVSDRRVSGLVQEWAGKYGWVVPLQSIAHPKAKRHDGRIYVEQRDVRGGETLEVGMNVDFALYCDVHGLGAGDVRVVPEEELEEEEKEAAEAEAEGGEKELLPAGWEKIWSEEHGRHYYWHKASKEAAWELPGVGGDDDEQEAAEGGAEAKPVGPPEDDFESPADDGGDKAGAADEDDAKDEDGPLLPGWEQQWSDKHGCHFYWHKATKQASWERPSMPRDEDDEEDAKPRGGKQAEEQDAAAEAEEQPRPVQAIKPKGPTSLRPTGYGPTAARPPAWAPPGKGPAPPRAAPGGQWPRPQQQVRQVWSGVIPAWPQPAWKRPRR